MGEKRAEDTVGEKGEDREYRGKMETKENPIRSLQPTNKALFSQEKIPPLDKWGEFCRMTMLFNKEAVDMVTRKLISNMYRIGGARQPRRRDLIRKGERKWFEESQHASFENNLREKAEGDGRPVSVEAENQEVLFFSFKISTQETAQ